MRHNRIVKRSISLSSFDPYKKRRIWIYLRRAMKVQFSTPFPPPDSTRHAVQPRTSRNYGLVGGGEGRMVAPLVLLRNTCTRSSAFRSDDGGELSLNTGEVACTHLNWLSSHSWHLVKVAGASKRLQGVQRFPNLRHHLCSHSAVRCMLLCLLLSLLPLSRLPCLLRNRRLLFAILATLRFLILLPLAFLLALSPFVFFSSCPMLSSSCWSCCCCKSR